MDERINHADRHHKKVEAKLYAYYSASNISVVIFGLRVSHSVGLAGQRDEQHQAKGLVGEVYSLLLSPVWIYFYVENHEQQLKYFQKK